MAKSYKSIKAGWSNPNSAEMTQHKRKKKYEDIKPTAATFAYVNDDYIKSFIKDSQEYMKNAEKDYDSVGYNDAAGVSSQYSEKSADLRARARAIKAFANVQKSSQLKDLSDYVDSFNDASSGISHAFDDRVRYFSQWETEEDYNRDVDNHTYTTKYKGNTYGDLQKKKAEITSKIAKAKGDEKAALERELYWLNNHSTDVQFVDTMTDEELDTINDDVNAKIKTLNEERSTIERRMYGYERGNLEYTDTYKKDEKRLAEIDAQLKELEDNKVNVLYYDENNKAVTVDMVKNRRKNEKILTEIDNDATSKVAYEKVLENEKDLDIALKIWNVVGVANSDATITKFDVGSQSAEAQQMIAYLSEKYGIDFNATPYNVFADVEALKNRLVKENKDKIKTFEGLGYDYDEISHYNREKIARETYKERMQEMEEIAEEHPIASTIGNILTAPAAIIDYGMNLYEAAKYGYSNIYDDNINASNTISSTISGKIEKDVLEKTESDTLAWLASRGYSGVTSATQSAITGIACTYVFGPVVGPKVALGILASEAAASSYNSAISNGSTNGEALLYSVASGAAEAFFEKIPLDNLLKARGGMDFSSMSNFIKSLGRGAKAGFGQALIESGEEFGTEISNKVADYIINGDHSEYYTTVNQLMKKGYSQTDANKIATTEVMNDILSATYGGFVGGMSSGSVNSALNLSGLAVGAAGVMIEDNRVAKKSGAGVLSNENLEKLITVARSLDGSKTNNKLRALAEELSGVDTSKLSEKEYAAFSKKVGKLHLGIQKTQAKGIINNNRDVVENMVREKVKESGITEADVDKATKAIMKTYYSEGALTAAESKVYENANGNQIVEELKNSHQDIVAKTNVSEQQRWGQYLETSSLTGKDAASVRNVDTDNYSISEDGKTRVSATGEVVEISDIDSIKNGDMVVKLSNGETTSLSNLELGNQNQAVVYQGILDIPGIDAAFAEKLINNFDFNDENSNAFNYVLGVQDAVKYGKIGGKAFVDTGVFTSELTKQQRENAYEVGTMLAEREAKAQAEKISKKVSANKGKTNKGKISFEGVDEKNLNARQKVSVNAIKALFSNIGVNIVFFESPVNEKGKHVGINGSYNAETNTIRLDIAAGFKGNDTILFTAAHELTHFIKEWSPEKFKAFADFLVKNYAKHGVDIETLIARRIENSKNDPAYDEPLDYEGAFEEIVCDSCETFLRDSNLMDKLVELAKMDMTLFEKIQLYIEELLENLKLSYAGLEPDSEEGKLVHKWTDCIDELHSLWEDAALSAIGNSKQGSVETKNTTSKGDVKTVFSSNRSNESKAIIEIINNNKDSISTDNKFNVESEPIPADITKSNYVYSVFEKEGKEAINATLGKVELAKSGAKSTVFHGFGFTKLAAVKALKPVIETGDIISFTENYENTGTNRYVIAAQGLINGEPSYVGAVVRTYPNNKNLSPKFYLHEAIIIETDSHIMTATQKSEKTVSESVSKETIPQIDKKSQEKNSTRDSEGNTLTQEQIEFFKDSKVRDENGNLLVCYHGTYSNFNVFSKDNTGLGYWFTEDKSFANQFGKNIKQAYLNLTNPLDVDTEDGDDTLAKVKKDLFGENAPESYLFSSVVKEELMKLRYDGMMWEHSGRKTIIVFNSNQIKLTTNTNPTSNPDIRYSTRDKAYMDAVNNNDMETAQRLVDEAAKRAGFNSPMLYHGTPTGFGFTIFDASKVDDKLSFFATNDERIAKTYSGETNRKNITDRITVDVDNASPAELLELLKNHIDKNYRLLSKSEIEEIKAPLYETIRNSSNIAREFVTENSDSFNDEKRRVAYRIVNSISAMADAESEIALDGARANYQDATWELRAIDQSIAYELLDAIDTTKLFRAVDDIDMYSNSKALFTNGTKTINDNSAWTILSSTLYTGVYSLYGNTEEMLEIDANGANWNRINTNFIQGVKHYVNVEDGYDSTDVPKMMTFNDAQTMAYNMAKSKYGEDAKIHTQDIRDEQGYPSSAAFRVVVDGMIGEKILVLQQSLQMYTNTRGLAKYAKDAGYKGVKISNLKDSGGAIQYNAPSDIYVFFNSNQMKSADPVTYDDNGNVIPLSERFDSSKKDIRFSSRDYSTVGTSAVMTNERIDYLIEDSGSSSPNYAQKWITSINPTDFINLTTGKWQDREKFDTLPGDYGSTVNEYDYIDGLKKNMRQTPYIAIDESGQVRGHEGRHRMRALEKQGITSAEIVMEFCFDSGHINKNYNSDGKRLQTVDSITVENQMGTGQTVTLNNIIPLNNDHKTEILDNYGEKTAKESDIKYQTRDPEAMAAYKKVNAQLTKENQKLTEDIADLKEFIKLQKTLTHGKMLKNSDIVAAAKNIMSHANAKGDIVEFANIIKEIYGYIANGEDVSWEVIKELSQVAVDWLRRNEIVKRERTEEATQMLKTLRGYNIRLDDKQKGEAAYRYGTYKNFRSRLFNKINITNDGVPLDSQWQEWTELYPGYFDKDVSANDQPLLLAELIESLEDSYVEDYYFEDEMYNQYLINLIYDKYWDVSTLHTFADARQKEINQLKHKHKERVAAIRQSHNERDLKLKAEYKDKIAKVKENYRAKSLEKVKKVAERYQESIKKSTENRNKTELKNKIRRVVKNLNSIFVNGNKQRNVKEDLKETVASALAASEILFTSNVTNDDIVRNGVEFATEEDSKLINEYNDLLAKREGYIGRIDAIKNANGSIEEIDGQYKMIDYIDSKIQTLNKKLSKVFEIERERIHRATVGTAIQSLSDAYESIKNSDYDYIKNAYSEYVKVRIDALKEELGGTLIKDMSLSQLQSVYDVYKMVQHTVSTSNDLFRDGKAENLEKVVTSVQVEIRKLAAKDKKDPWVVADRIAETLKAFTWNDLKPYYAFERLGSKTYQSLFWDAIKAESVYAKDILEAKEFIEAQVKDLGYSKWDLKTAKTFKTTDGKDFKLTLPDIMSIYAYSKREQAYDHMTVGGFVFDTGSTYKETKNGKTKKHVRLSDTYKVDLNVLSEIVNSLTPEQQAFVERVQAYLTSLGKEKGNVVSRALFGIDIFNEDFYMPLKSEKDYRSSMEQVLNNTQTQVSLKNTGMTKQTKPHAKNPIVLRGFMDVVLEHIDSMAKYHAFVIPIENLQRVFNNVTMDGNGNFISTQALITSVFGESAKQYFDQYIKDLNGGVNENGVQNPLSTMFSRAKKTAVAASLSVMVQQPFAIVRAMSEINPAHFIPFLNSKASKTDMKTQWEELKKYAPVAIIKEMGGFDIGSKRTSKDYIGGDYGPKDLQYVLKKIDDISMLGAEMGDKIGWSILWKAVKKEVAAEQKLTPGTEEFYKACGERFTEVVAKTQVYDSVNNRSAYMRSKKESVKFLTSFMGEPTTIINMAFSSHLELSRAIKGKDKAQIKKARARLTRTNLVLIASALFTSLAKSLVYAGQDDDDDESLLEKWAKHFGSSLRDDINPLNLVPVGRDIMSLIDGWDVERPDMTLIADIINSARKLDDDSTAEDWYNFAATLANATGIPLKNVGRSVMGIIGTTSGIVDDKNATDIVGAFATGFSGDNDYTLKERAERAYKKGNTAGVRTAINDMIKVKTAAGKTEKEAKAAVKASFTATYKPAYEDAVARRDFTEMNEIRKLLYATGLYGTLSELDKTLKKWRTGE